MNFFLIQIRGIKYQRRKLRYALFTMNKKYRKQKDLAEDESDIDDDWIAQYEDENREKEIEKAKKKFAKDNEKRAADGDKPLDETALEERVDKIIEEYDRLKEERGSQDVEIKGKKSEESILSSIEKLDQRIKNEKFKRDDKDKLKEVSLGTRYVPAFGARHGVDHDSVNSKINYLDPRLIPFVVCLMYISLITCFSITTAWCKAHDVPVEKLFNKSLIVKCELP